MIDAAPFGVVLVLLLYWCMSHAQFRSRSLDLLTIKCTPLRCPTTLLVAYSARICITVISRI